MLFSFLRALHAKVFFFFSSRRRHTSYWRDWSSDVCSSDLPSGRGWPCGVVWDLAVAVPPPRAVGPRGCRGHGHPGTLHRNQTISGTRAAPSHSAGARDPAGAQDDQPARRPSLKPANAGPPKPHVASRPSSPPKLTTNPTRYQYEAHHSDPRSSNSYGLPMRLSLASVRLVAGRGRPPQAAARRAGVEKSRGSCNERNDQRIDRPLLPERPGPDGRCPARGHAGASSAQVPRWGVLVSDSEEPLPTLSA